MTGERQLNHSESEGVCVNCLSSFNKLQTRFPKEPGVSGLFVVQGEIRYTYIDQYFTATKTVRNEASRMDKSLFVPKCLHDSFWMVLESESDVTKSGDPYTELVLCIYPSQVHTHTAVKTHTVNTHPKQWAAIYAAATGEKFGVRCLAQEHFSRGIEVEREHCTFLPPTEKHAYNFLFNLQKILWYTLFHSIKSIFFLANLIFTVSESHIIYLKY